MSAMTRSPLLVAAVAGALALGACGGGGGGSGGAKSQQDKAFAGALKFAKCMRDHGVDVPDPKKDGNGPIKIMAKAGAKSAGKDNAKMQAAQKACQKYLKAGGGRAPSAAEQARVKDAMLAYTRCMRSRGVKIADPQFTSDGGILNKAGGPGQTNPRSPTFRAADKVCRPKLGDLGGGGPSSQSEAKP
jgi:hypothetical protein